MATEGFTVNPNLAKGLGVSIVLALVGLYALKPATEKAAPARVAPAAAAPAYAVNLVNLDCGSRGVDRAKVTIENRGVEIPFAKVFVEFVNKDGSVAVAEDGFFSPSTIPAGARASATVYARRSQAESCRIGAVVDGDGNRVPLI